MVNYAQQSNFSGIDEVVMNQRTRATTPGLNAQGVLWMSGTGVVTSVTGATGTTMTAAQLGGGIFIYNATASAQTVTLDSATNILAYMNANSAGVNVGDIIQCLLINGGSTNTFTVTAGSGGTSDTNQPTITVLANASRNLTVRITNTTTPAYVVYA
jgi:hypothetical protein